MSDDVASARPAPPRDVADIVREVVAANPREMLQLLCGITLREDDVITSVPAPWAHGEVHVDMMWAALQAAYGDIADLDELAWRLAVRDPAGNIARIVGGATLDDLRA